MAKRMAQKAIVSAEFKLDKCRNTAIVAEHPHVGEYPNRHA